MPHVIFVSRPAAYRFVSEIRRRSRSLLWDIGVRRRKDGADVVIPEDVWEHEPFMESVAASHGGEVEDEAPTGPSDAAEGR